MKRHISILTFLLCAFAAAGTAFAVEFYALSTHPCEVSGGGEIMSFDAKDQDNGGYYCAKHKAGGYGVTDLFLNDSGDYSSITADEPDGLRFKGWWTKKGGWSSEEAEVSQVDACIETSRTASSTTIKNAGTWGGRPTIVAKYVKLHTLTIAIDPVGSGTVSTNGVGVNEVIVEDGGSVTLKATANAGWKFEEWSDGVTSNPRTVSKVSADATYTADFKAQFKTVTLKKCGGTGGTGSVVVTNGMALPKIAVPTRTGYDFTGYFTSETGDGATQYYTSDGQGARAWDATEERNVLYARWKGKEFYLEFNDQGADKKSGQGTKMVVYGENPGPVAIPTKSNYTFIGYFYNDVRYWDENGTWNGGVWTASDRTVEIFARYRADSYTIKFNRNGGTEGSYTDLTKDVDEQFALPDGKALSYERHAFAGWALSEGGEKKFDGGATTTVAANISSEPPNPKVLTFYAVWTDLSRTVRFNAGSAEATVDPQTKLVEVGKPFGELATGTWPGDRCTLAGWRNEAGEEITADSIVPESTGDIDLAARWTTNSYTVVFHENGGTGEMSDQKVPFYETASLASNRFVRAGYHFIGWATNETDDVTYADGAEVRDLVSAKDESVDLYAKWTANGYQVAFFGNGGTNEMAVQSFTYDVEQALTSNRFVREGFDFAGWATDPTNGVAYADGTNVLNLTTKKDATVRLFAKWTAAGGEVSEWSKALGCDNLDIEPTEEEGIAIGEGAPGVRIDVKKFNTDGLWAHGLAWTLPEMGMLTIGYRTTINAAPNDPDGNPKPAWASAFSFNVDFSPEVDPVRANGEGTWIFTNKSPESVQIQLLLETKNGDIIGGPGRTDSDNDFAQVLSVRWEPAVTNASFVGVTFRTNDGTPSPEDIYTNVTRQAGEAYGALPVLADRDSGAQFLGWVRTPGEGSFVSPDWIVPADSKGTQLHAAWSVVTNAVPAAVPGLVYNGGAQTGVAAGKNYTLVGNVATNAGDHVATATLTDGVWEGGSSAPTNIAWTIAKATVDMSGATFASATYEFDGKEHSIAVAGVPSGVEVVYSGDATNRTEVGTNTVTASFVVLDELNYNTIATQMVATLAITAKEDPPGPTPEPVVTNAVPAAIPGLVYNGRAQTGVAAGANYTIVGNVATNAGGYRATATVTNGVWEGGAAGATNIAWTIAKGTKDVSGITFPDAMFEYDGEEHSFGIVGDLPSGVSVAYDGATNRTEVGTNTVTASFVVADTNNWNGITTTLTAKLVITSKEDPPEPFDGSAANNYVIMRQDGSTLVISTAKQTVRNGVATSTLTAKLTVGKKTYSFKGGKITDGMVTALPICRTSGVPQFGELALTRNEASGVFGTEGICGGRLKQEDFDAEFIGWRQHSVLRVGVAFSATVGVSERCGPVKFSASKLPSGLKIGKATGEISGVPTKAKEFLTRITATSTVSSKLKACTDFPVVIEPLDGWAIGTFNGGGGNCQVKITVSKVGKVSGQLLTGGLKWTLSAKSFGDYSNGVYYATLTCKNGKATCTNCMITVSESGLVGVCDEVGGTFSALRNEWKDAEWKQIAKGFPKAAPLVLQPVGEGFDANDTITLKFSSSGAVTAKGQFVKSYSSAGRPSYYSVSCSTVLCPLGEPDEAGAFTGTVQIYYPPKAGTPLASGYVDCVTVRWTGYAFELAK